MAKITAPVEKFTGSVAGVTFKDGTASTKDERALAYFRRHGYGIELTAAEQKAAKDSAPAEDEGSDPATPTEPSNDGDPAAK